MNIIAIANKMDMSYDFYFKHNIHAVERKLIMLINKDKTLLSKLNRPWRHSLIKEYNIIRVKNIKCVY